MTTLERPLVRRVTSARGAPLVLRLAPEGAYLREPKRRTWFGPLDWGYLYTHAARLTADRVRRERAQKRRPK